LNLHFHNPVVKALLSAVLAMMGAMAFGAGLTSVQIDGNTYTNITDVHISGGRIIMLFPGGGTSASADKVPLDFLASWNISPAAQTNAVAAEAIAKARRKAANAAERANARAAAIAETENDLEQLIQSGVFREVDGVVYDIRNPESGWVPFQDVKVFQVLDEGAIIDSTPNIRDYKNDVPIFVKNLPTISDTDFIAFEARPNGTFAYVNKLGDDRTIHAYDVGRICDRSEIPLSVLSGQKAFDALAGGRPQMADVVASLPDSKNLKVSGSGFFISEDGYLITNAHVVRNARSVKVKTGTGVFPAAVVRVDERDDFALLKVAGRFTALWISTNDAALGDSVFTIGFPDIVLQGTQPKFTDGKISSLTGLMDDPAEYQISVPVQPGNSGGPLVDLRGCVQGVIVARLDESASLRSVGSLPQNVNYAIKSRLLRGFLRAFTQIKLVADKPAEGGSSTVETVQKSVAIVLVYY
jgi:S1-C subfamily serine protease